MLLNTLVRNINPRGSMCLKCLMFSLYKTLQYVWYGCYFVVECYGSV